MRESEYDSNHPDRGSRRETAAPVLGTRTILVVDDDPDMRYYLRGCLERFHRADRVAVAADGLEALDLARAGDIDVVICDIVMPRLDGCGLWECLRTDPDLRQIPVLTISGKEAGGCGHAFLAKPFNARQLRVALEDLIEAGDARVGGGF